MGSNWFAHVYLRGRACVNNFKGFLNLAQPTFKHSMCDTNKLCQRQRTQGTDLRWVTCRFHLLFTLQYKFTVLFVIYRKQQYALYSR